MVEDLSIHLKRTNPNSVLASLLFSKHPDVPLTCIQKITMATKFHMQRALYDIENASVSRKFEMDLNLSKLSAMKRKNISPWKHRGLCIKFRTKRSKAILINVGLSLKSFGPRGLLFFFFF